MVRPHLSPPTFFGAGKIIMGSRERFKMVRVVWIDAVATNEWKTIPELKKEEHDDTTPCITVGFLVRSNRQYYYVAGTISVPQGDHEPLVNGIMMIPKKWVKEFTEIEIEN